MKGAAACVFALAAVSCGPSAAPEWQGSIEQRDGTTFVTNPAVGLWQGREPEPVRFVLEQVFGSDAGPDEAILGETRQISIDVDDAGRVYVLDGQEDRIVVFEPDGAVRWAAGGTGQGPGEITTALGIAVSDAGTVAIANDMGRRVDLWDGQGEFAYSVNLAEPPLTASDFLVPRAIGFLDNDTVALGGGLRGAFGSVGYELRLEPPDLATRCVMNERPDEEIPRGFSAGPDVREQGGRFFFGASGPYVLRMYGRECDLLRVVTLPREYPVRPEFWQEERRAGLASLGEINAPLVLANGFWLVSTYWVEGIADPVADAKRRAAALIAGQRLEPPAYNASLDLFDERGRYLWSHPEPGRRIPAIGRLAVVGPDGRLYTVTDEPFPQIRRYRVEFDD